MSTAFPSLGVRIDALGAEQATRKVQAFGKSVGRLPRDMSEAGRSARKLEFNMQKMSFAMFGASLAITTTVTSLSRLDRAAQRVDKTSVALSRGQDLLARKQLNLNRIMKNGERVQGELAITLSEVKTAQDDLIVKSRELEIVTGEVSDTYINFAASLGASLLFAITAFFSAVKGLNLAHAKGAIRAAAHAVSIGLIRTSVATTSPAIQGITVATQASTISMIKATFAAHGLAAGIKAILLSLGPLGIALIAGGALLTLYATNIGGTADKMNMLLGITEETTAATDDLVPSMNDLNSAMIGAQDTAPLLGKSLSDIGKQIRFIAETAPAAAEGIRQIQVQAGIGGGAAVGGGTLSKVPKGPRGVTPLGIPAVIGGTPTIPGGGTITGPFDLSLLPGPTLRAASINEQIKALETSLDNILRKTKQIAGERVAIRKILESTKNDSEAIAIIEDLIVQKKALALELDGNARLEMEGAANALARALQIETLILQRKREQLLTQKEQTSETFKSVNLLFDFLFGRGLVGQSVRFGRSGGGAAGLGGGSFGQGVGGQFLGFQSGVGSTITVGGQTFTSRANNPAFGQTLGGGAAAAIAGAPNFANTGFATGGGGNASGTKLIRGKESLRAGIILGIPGGRLGRTESKIVQGFGRGIFLMAEKVRAAAAVGVLPGTPAELFAQGFTVGEIVGMATEGLKQLGEGLTSRAAAVGITDLGKFLPDVFKFSRATKSGLAFKKTQENITSAAEFKAAIARVLEAEERSRLIDELQRIINRRIALAKFIADRPGEITGTGVNLVVDITPMAEALEKILSGEDHNQFIKLTGQSKI